MSSKRKSDDLDGPGTSVRESKRDKTVDSIKRISGVVKACKVRRLTQIYLTMAITVEFDCKKKVVGECQFTSKECPCFVPGTKYVFEINKKHPDCKIREDEIPTTLDPSILVMNRDILVKEIIHDEISKLTRAYVLGFLHKHFPHFQLTPASKAIITTRRTCPEFQFGKITNPSQFLLFGDNLIIESCILTWLPYFALALAPTGAGVLINNIPAPVGAPASVGACAHAIKMLVEKGVEDMAYVSRVLIVARTRASAECLSIQLGRPAIDFESLGTHLGSESIVIVHAAHHFSAEELTCVVDTVKGRFVNLKELVITGISDQVSHDPALKVDFNVCRNARETAATLHKMSLVPDVAFLCESDCHRYRDLIMEHGAAKPLRVGSLCMVNPYEHVAVTGLHQEDRFGNKTRVNASDVSVYPDKYSIHVSTVGYNNAAVTNSRFDGSFGVQSLVIADYDKQRFNPVKMIVFVATTSSIKRDIYNLLRWLSSHIIIVVDGSVTSACSRQAYLAGVAT